MPTAADANTKQSVNARASRAPTPSSSFIRAVARKTPPVYNRDADEELVAAALEASRRADRQQSFLHSGEHSAKGYNPRATFVQVHEQRAAASQWRSNAAARKVHEARQIDRYLHSFVPTGYVHPGAIAREQRAAQDAAMTSLIISDASNTTSSSNNISSANNVLVALPRRTPTPVAVPRPRGTASTPLPPPLSGDYYSGAEEPTTQQQQRQSFEADIAVFEDKLSSLRREQRKKEEERSKRGGGGSAIPNSALGGQRLDPLAVQQQQKQLANSSAARLKTASTSDCAPFALPKVLQMLFRLLLSRSLSATDALRAVGFPELRARLSAAAEGGMVKRHAFEAIFLECLKTDRARLEHAAVVDCFLLDAGGDAELAFVLIALQVLLGIASAADVMRYCFYLLDTSSRVPRYLTRLELEALLREAEAAAAANPASKDDAEYTSMRGAVVQILDTNSQLFDGKGRMPLSTFLEKLRAAMNDAAQDAISLSAADTSGAAAGGGANLLSSNNSSASGGINAASASKRSASSSSRKRARQQAAAQLMDGLASRHDLFHHSTSRRIVLQTAPDELVKDG